MEKQGQKKKELTLKSSQRQAFLQIFNMHAKNGKITKKDLHEIFVRINYSISQKHFSQICRKAFQDKQQIDFEQFMRSFKINQQSFQMVDVKNAFRLIAGQEDQFIPINKLYDIFGRQGISKQQIDDLITVLSVYVDSQKNIFNYKLFLSHLS